MMLSDLNKLDKKQDEIALQDIETITIDGEHTSHNNKEKKIMIPPLDFSKLKLNQQSKPQQKNNNNVNNVKINNLVGNGQKPLFKLNMDAVQK